ncbi:hypothetical protein HRI_004587700 [Hibiscus trionum]|uniref:Uncharacterized protein n=1 Tax=Hibiscus trionum TaxID=183268 RepID=A0A9W7J711_HIBTR|nr:hypothetical protein HRI_004587700 [Hibiscus trionum]
MTSEPVHAEVYDETELYQFDEALSDEEPRTQVGPDGDEMGLFPHDPSDLDEPVESEESAENSSDNDTEDDEDDDVRSTNLHGPSSCATYYEPHSHFTIVDMDGFFDTEFPKYPQLDHFNQWNVGSTELHVGMVFRKKNSRRLPSSITT